MSVQQNDCGTNSVRDQEARTKMRNAIACLRRYSIMAPSTGLNRTRCICNRARETIEAHLRQRLGSNLEAKHVLYRLRYKLLKLRRCHCRTILYPQKSLRDKLLHRIASLPSTSVTIQETRRIPDRQRQQSGSNPATMISTTNTRRQRRGLI